jgi:hypothetical protein
MGIAAPVVPVDCGDATAAPAGAAAAAASVVAVDVSASEGTTMPVWWKEKGQRAWAPQ